MFIEKIVKQVVSSRITKNTRTIYYICYSIQGRRRIFWVAMAYFICVGISLLLNQKINKFHELENGKKIAYKQPFIITRLQTQAERLASKANNFKNILYSVAIRNVTPLRSLSIFVNVSYPAFRVAMFTREYDATRTFCFMYKWGYVTYRQICILENIFERQKFCSCIL